LVSGINDQQILKPFCGTDSDRPHQLSSERRSLEEDFIFQKYDDFICRESRVATRKLSTYWANDPRVQEALHVRKPPPNNPSYPANNNHRKTNSITASPLTLIVFSGELTTPENLTAAPNHRKPTTKPPQNHQNPDPKRDQQLRPETGNKTSLPLSPFTMFLRFAGTSSKLEQPDPFPLSSPDPAWLQLR
ncbi:hypothetical protein KY284_012182, partial [Solanum tuberosum]